MRTVLSALALCCTLAATAQAQVMHTTNDADTTQATTPADDQTAATAVTPLAPTAPTNPNRIQITRSSDAIFIKETQRLLFDQEQTAAAKRMTALLQAQFAKMSSEYNATMDPNGDLKAIKAALSSFSTDLNDLVDAAAQMYGNVIPLGGPWNQQLGQALDPSGFVLFVTAEYDKNLVSVPFLAPAVQGGGSVTIAIVCVPMRTTRIELPQAGVTAKSEPVTYTDWDAKLFVMPSVNAGVGVTTTGSGQNVRYGFGLVFGDVRGAGDIAGWSYGASVTAAAPILQMLPGYLKADGVNLKILGVKNSDKDGAVTNVLALVGFENSKAGTTRAFNGKIFNIDVESHLNISYIWDFTKFFASMSNAASKLTTRVVGTDPAGPHIAVEK